MCFNLRFSRLKWIFAVAVAILIAGCTHGSGEVERRLESAESFIESRPDSSLLILDSITPKELRDDRSRALHALLLTRARLGVIMNHNMPQIDDISPFLDDSLLSIATDYFDRHNEPDMSFWCHYMKGEIYIATPNRHDYRKSMNEYMQALSFLKEDSNPLFHAIIHRALAGMYGHSHEIGEAITHYEMAMKFYKQAGDERMSLNCARNLSGLYATYDNDKRIDYTKSLAILDSIAPISDSVGDYTYQVSYIKPLLATGQYDLAYNYLTMDMARDPYFFTYIEPVVTIYTSIGKPDSASYYLERFKEIVSPWREMSVYHKAAYILEKSRGDYKSALESHEKYSDLEEWRLRTMLDHKAVFGEMDYYNEVSMRERLKAERNRVVTISLIVILILLTIGFCFFYRIRMQRRKSEMEEKMAEASELLRQLDRNESYLSSLRKRLEESETRLNDAATIMAQKDKRLHEQAEMVGRLFKEQFKILDSLSNEYFEKRDSEMTRVSVVRDFERELDRIKTPESLKRVEDVVDSCCDGILTRIRLQFPKFKDNDILFLALNLAGFSPRSICLLMDMKLGNYYNKWTRLRARIASSDAPDKDFFLSTLQK